jgi:hypothetical protein
VELHSMQAIADACRDWIAAAKDPAGFTPLDTVEHAREQAEDLEAKMEDVRNSLEQFLVELRGWRAANGTASSQEIFARIGTDLAEPTRGFEMPKDST